MAINFVSNPDETGLTPTERLVKTCYTINWEDLPATEQEHAISLLADFFGVLLGSTDAVESSRIVRDYASTFGDGPSSIVGINHRSPPPTAAFTNASIAHGIELDDTHSGSSTHPGVVIIPSALSVAEQTGATGREMLAAIVGGYELLIRIGRAADAAALYDRGFHPTAVCGVFAAALTAARLRGLDETAAGNAVGIAGSFAAGSLEYLEDGTLSKRIQPGVAAQSGIIAAALADRGYTGPRTILEGENGFLQGYSDRGSTDRLFLSPDDEFEYEIARTGVKPHACCRYNQTPIDCMLAIATDYDIDSSDVSSITVEVVDPAREIVAEPIEEKIQPRTPTDAQFSLPYSVAVAFEAGQAFSEQFREPYLSDESVLSLAKLVSAQHAPDLDPAYPDKWGARVTVTLKDGATLEQEFDTCRGDPENMLSDAALEDKVRTLAGRQLDEQGVEELLTAIRSLPDADGIDRLSAALPT